MLTRISCMAVFRVPCGVARRVAPLSLPAALPIYSRRRRTTNRIANANSTIRIPTPTNMSTCLSLEEHTSELQSRQYLVCRLLLEKNKMGDVKFAEPVVGLFRDRSGGVVAFESQRC